MVATKDHDILMLNSVSTYNSLWTEKLMERKKKELGRRNQVAREEVNQRVDLH